MFCALAHPHRSLHEIPDLLGRLSRVGPVVWVWPIERDDRPKMGRNTPKMAEFGGRNGAQWGYPGCPHRGVQRELRVDMQLAA
ncbi:UNVERIFIED_CONTAM: hypothetical protein Sradi_6152600 [Sesamum radiatum]|uniref:Uncharacterized protein n=1 Tax=Sesamum radiatum TaxID=300843 RepID=A0AAW2KLK2_SESRA